MASNPAPVSGPDIVVVANPDNNTGGSPQVPSSGPPGSGVDAQIRANNAAAANSATVESDVTGDDIVVIARTIRAQVLNLLMQLTPGRTLQLPCVGGISTPTLREIVLGLKFNITNKIYGENRAGENLVGGSQGGVPVNINADALRVYSKHTGGINYLILHEVAHAVQALRDFNKSQFEAFARQDAIKGLPLAQQYDAYAKSPGFFENEKRANTVGKAIGAALNNFGTMTSPTNGFSTQC